MSVETMRQDFESWYAEERAKQRPYSTVNLKDICFQAWIASRAAVVVVLPKFGDYVCRSDIQATILGDCEDAIEAAGLKVKQ